MKYETEKISRKAFNKLLEYSCSLPTRTTIGKVWKKDRNFGSNTNVKDWLICEFITDPQGDPTMVGIEYRIPDIID